MSSLIATALSKIMGKTELNVMMVGFDDAGKTTILYKLKLGESITTIPTNGFIVESVQHKNATFTICDVGQRPPYWYHYFHYAQIVIFVFDSTDEDRIDDAKDELQRLSYSLPDAVFLILANKQDKPNALTVNELSKRLFSSELKNITYNIMGCCAITGDGLHDALDWIYNTQKKHKKVVKKRNELSKMIQNNNTKIILFISGFIRDIVSNNKLMSFVAVHITKLIHKYFQDPNVIYKEYEYYGEFQDIDDLQIEIEKPDILIQFLSFKQIESNYINDNDKFIEYYWNKYNKNNKYKYKERDHYNLLRLIWILFNKYDRQKGLKEFWKLTPYNRTMSYFWAHLVYFGMSKHVKCNNDFDCFLVMNPSFCNDYKILMKKYYSKEVLKIINDEKKNEMILPDIQKSLPSIMTDIKSLKQKNINYNINDENNYKENKNDDDEYFIKQFENRTFKSWNGHESFLRVCWFYINEYDGSQEAVKKIKKSWKEFIGINYHETKVYFWIHMVRYFRVLFREYINNKNKNKYKWNFNDFIHFCGQQKKKNCEILNEKWWNQFYSASLIDNPSKQFSKTFHGTDAKKDFILPNIKDLPQLKFVSKQKK